MLLSCLVLLLEGELQFYLPLYKIRLSLAKLVWRMLCFVPDKDLKKRLIGLAWSRHEI